MSARQAFAQWREDRRKRRSGQETSVGESEEPTDEREQAAKRTRSELNAAKEAEREQADNVQGNELY